MAKQLIQNKRSDSKQTNKMDRSLSFSNSIKMKQNNYLLVFALALTLPICVVAGQCADAACQAPQEVSEGASEQQDQAADSPQPKKETKKKAETKAEKRKKKRKQSADKATDNSAANEALASEDELYNRKREAFANPKVDNPDLPNVLLIGDSISIGYTPYVRRKLAGKADVYRIKGNAQTSSTGVKNLDSWLKKKPAKWDVVHFNWGLWDLCYRHPKSKVQGHRDKVNGTLAITLDQYQANMEKNVARLKETDAKLIWCATTPVPEKEAGRKVGDDLKYNKIAEEIMKANGVLINDLHSHALLKLPEIMAQEGDVHFNEPGYRHLADKVAAEILSAISQ